MDLLMENDADFVLAIALKSNVSIWQGTKKISSGGQVEWVNSKMVKIADHYFSRQYYQFRMEPAISKYPVG
ncbi:hypothetical protein [Paenibacillus senegalensis]|uniref:hypothetical protein n=1 Tax=Paenibacillus senegalensis TaxID=1465766 RepID=UPI00028A114D|nr:hypothetical protein [Paenibacillus senegalensis]